MAFTDQVKKAVNSAVNSAGKFASNVTDSSKKLAEKTKLKSKIKNEESAINGIYLTMGKTCFEKDGETTKEDFAENIASIKNHLAEIDSLNARIAAIDGTNVCTCCGKQISASVKFCSNCGTANENYKEPTEEAEEVVEETVEPEIVENTDADVYVDTDAEEEN